MKDTDLYSQILGLSALWVVDAVELNTAEGRVDIHVGHGPGVRWACPTCGRELACRDHDEPRVWRHLDTCQFKTLLHARIPRVDCPDHGVVQVKVPWAENKGRFTLLMERLIIDVLTECATLTGARRIMRITWDEAWGVMESAVRRGRERKQLKPARYLGVDEKAFRKGHGYMTIVCDLIGSTVEFVAEERKAESLEGYYRQFTQEQLGHIKAVAMDMWEPYFKATLKHVPGAAGKIVHDRFHIMKHVGEAVDRVRKHEHRELLAQEDQRLKGTKYLWLYREENVPDKHRPALEALKAANLKVAIDLIIAEICSGPIVNMDETTVQVLAEPGRANIAKSFMWVARGGIPEKPVVLFRYHPTRAGSVAAEIIGDFKGYLQTDGYSGYEALGEREGLRHLGCLAHVRRKFVEVEKSAGKKAKGGTTHAVLDLIGKLYGVERQADKQKLDPEQTKALQEEKSRPILDKLKALLDARVATTPSKSLLGKAIGYALKQWDRLPALAGKLLLL